MSGKRTLYLGTNTKMFKTAAQTEDYLKELQSLTKDLDREDLELFVIPSFTAIKPAAECAAASRIRIGAQNICWEEEGAFSGEISPLMAAEAGASIIMIGHSERRHIFGESNEMENKKVLCALRNHFTALLCIGETAEEKAFHISDEVLSTQLKIGRSNVAPNVVQNVWIAYEPVWAIGVNGVPAAADYIQQRHAAIRQCLSSLFGPEQAIQIPILYGGSVNRENAVKISGVPNVDGLFIGRSAWNAQSFNQIIRDILATKRM